MSVVSTSPIDSDGLVRCFEHNLPAALKTSHTLTNPGRKFYCCPKDISDPDRCKFFFWADAIDELHQMNHTPRKRTSSSLDEQPETPSQKRFRLIQQALDDPPHGSQPPSTPSTANSQFPPTPPNTNRRSGRRYTPDGSPTPLPRNLRDDDEHNSQLEFPMLPLSVDQTASRRMQELVDSLEQLHPDIQRLERQKVAGDKENEAKRQRIEQLMAENNQLKKRILAQEEQIKDLKKMNKALLDTRPA